MEKSGRKIAAVIIAILFLFSSMPVYGAETSKESRSITILSVSGSDAKVKKGGKTTVNATDGMKLGQGYTVTTGKSTTVYFQIDDDKVIKMDSGSSVAISLANSKKLKLTLKSGEIFFDVKKPVEKGSEVSFQVGGTSMGIRGTAGFLNLKDDIVKVGLFEGKSEWMVGGSQMDIAPGEIGVVSANTDNQSNAQIETFDLTQCSAFAAIAALENPESVDLSQFDTSNISMESLQKQWSQEQQIISQEQSEVEDIIKVAQVKPSTKYSSPANGGSEGNKTSSTNESNNGHESGGSDNHGKPNPTPNPPDDGGNETPDVPDDGGNETPDVPDDGGNETPDVPDDGGNETPDVPDDGGNETPDVPDDGGNEIPDVPDDDGNETPDVPDELGWTSITKSNFKNGKTANGSLANNLSFTLDMSRIKEQTTLYIGVYKEENSDTITKEQVYEDEKGNRLVQVYTPSNSGNASVDISFTSLNYNTKYVIAMTAKSKDGALLDLQKVKVKTGKEKNEKMKINVKVLDGSGAEVSDYNQADWIRQIRFTLNCSKEEAEDVKFKVTKKGQEIEDVFDISEDKLVYTSKPEVAGEYYVSFFPEDYNHQGYLVRLTGSNTLELELEQKEMNDIFVFGRDNKTFSFDCSVTRPSIVSGTVYVFIEKLTDVNAEELTADKIIDNCYLSKEFAMGSDEVSDGCKTTVQIQIPQSEDTLVLEDATWYRVSVAAQDKSGNTSNVMHYDFITGADEKPEFELKTLAGSVGNEKSLLYLPSEKIKELEPYIMCYQSNAAEESICSQKPESIEDVVNNPMDITKTPILLDGLAEGEMEVYLVLGAKVPGTEEKVFAKEMLKYELNVE